MKDLPDDISDKWELVMAPVPGEFHAVHLIYDEYHSVYIKWDGCVNIHQDDDIALHLCDPFAFARDIETIARYFFPEWVSYLHG